MTDIGSIKPELLNSGFLNNVLYFEEIDSTNDYISPADIPPDTIVIADHQTKGKGRNSNSWESEKNKNLTFSLKKDFKDLQLGNSTILNYFSYCIFLTISDFLKRNGIRETEKKLWIKWPNDIYYNDKKLCGILSESKFGTGIYVIGIGINCNQLHFSDKINAVSLQKITGKEADRNKLLISLIKTFSHNLDLLSNSQKSELFKKWKNSTKMINKGCEFTTPDGKTNNGIISDLNEDGSILILVNNDIKKFYSGDLKLTTFR